jgi:hypothetical protein
MDLNTQVPVNVGITSGPGQQLDYDHHVQEARLLFERLYPGEEFLPRAPDPEEIVIEDAAVDRNPGNDGDGGNNAGEGFHGNGQPGGNENDVAVRNNDDNNTGEGQQGNGGNNTGERNRVGQTTDTSGEKNAVVDGGNSDTLGCNDAVSNTSETAPTSKAEISPSSVGLEVTTSLSEHGSNARNDS